MPIDWGDDELFRWQAPVGKLERQFWEFHYTTPVVYETLAFYAREWMAAGHVHCSMQLLYERARWQIGLKRDQDGLKLNNNHCAYYARLLHVQEPDLRGLFKFRKLRVAPSFGPDNDTLPDNEHIA